MNNGTVELGNASITIGYSQVVQPNQRGKLRELTEFEVKEDYRGKGEGTKLLQEICEQADNESIFLMLLAKNERLKKYYERFKFVQINEIDDMLLVRKPQF